MADRCAPCVRTNRSSRGERTLAELAKSADPCATWRGTLLMGLRSLSRRIGDRCAPSVGTAKILSHLGAVARVRLFRNGSPRPIFEIARHDDTTPLFRCGRGCHGGGGHAAGAAGGTAVWVAARG